MIVVFNNQKDNWSLQKKDLIAIYPSLGVGALASLVFMYYSFKSDKSFKIFDMLVATGMSAATAVLFTYVIYYDVLYEDEKFDNYPENIKWVAVCVAVFFLVLVPVVLLISTNIRTNIHFFPFENYLDNINIWSVLLSPSLIPSYIFKFIYKTKTSLPDFPSFPEFNDKFRDSTELDSFKYFSYEKQNLFYFGGTLNRKITVTIILGLLFALAPYLYIKNNPKTVKKEEGETAGNKEALEEERSFFSRYPDFISLILSVITCLWLVFLFGVKPRTTAPVKI
jgi:uncharacterized membrane protein